MRTNMSQWLKVTFALLMCAILVTAVKADDDDPKPKRTKEERAALKAKKAEDRRLGRLYKTQTPVAGFEPIEMFDAMASGEVEVVIKTKSAADSNLIVRNKTDKPLAIQMPAAFSAVPVVRQGFGAPGGGLGGGGLGGGGLGGGGLGGGGLGGGGLGGGQGVGGGLGGGLGGGGLGGGLGGGGGGLGGGGGVFNIPAGKTGRLEVKTFCLEEGKPDPKLFMEYKIQPLEKLNTDPRIFEMCRMLANDEVAQPVAQAAAWHVANNLSWQQLLLKNRVERMDGSFERYFHPNHLRFAQQVVIAAVQRADSRQKLTPKTKPVVPHYDSSIEATTSKN